MALKTSVDKTVGPRSTPQSIRDLRKSSFDYHDQLGQPVIVKHRWNERDLREGLAQRCPYHDEDYDEDLATCPYCFGTGYLGGFADGVLTYVTIADAAEDVFRITDQGLMLHDRSPGLTAPWTPRLGDDDLIITVELDPRTGEVQDTYDRYTLRQTTPTTIRGPGFKNTRNGLPYVVNQTATIDVVPYGSILMDVPITFDYSVVPGQEGSSESFEIPVRVAGLEGNLLESFSIPVRIEGFVQTGSVTEADIRVTGKAGGTHVVID